MPNSFYYSSVSLQLFRNMLIWAFTIYVKKHKHVNTEEDFSSSCLDVQIVDPVTFCNKITRAFSRNFDLVKCTVVPTKSESDAIFCLQLLSKTLTLHSI